MLQCPQNNKNNSQRETFVAFGNQKEEVSHMAKNIVIVC